MSDHEPFLGIDFGTAYSAMAWVHPDSGQADILCNAEGEEKTRSAVYFGPEGTLVGRLAEELLEDENEASRVLLSIKRDLAKNAACGMVEGKPVTAIDVAVKILEKLKTDAEQTNFHRPIHRAVITVPASFDPLEKEIVEEAGRRAGFHEVKLLEEPVAAAIAYLKAGLNVGRRILVFDLGAGTFDAAILDREEDDIHPFHVALEPRGEQVGGDDFDRTLMYHILEDLPHAADDRSFVPRLLYRCRRLKETLSHRDSHVLSMLLPNGNTLRKEVSRDTLESLITASVMSMVRICTELVEQATADGGSPDTLVLIGGSARIPFVGRKLTESLSLVPRAWHRQDVAVALGAAYYGEILWGFKAAKTYRGILRKTARKTINLVMLRDLEQERVRLDLPTQQANRLETEEIGHTLEFCLAQEVASAEKEYQDLLRDVWRNGVLDYDDLRTLQNKADQLGLIRQQAADVECTVLGASKEKLFQHQQDKRQQQAEKRLALARSLRDEGKLDDALASAASACDVDAQFLPAHRLRREILHQQQRWEAAESAATVCLSLDPTSSHDRFARAVSRMEQRHDQDSLLDFNAVLAEPDLIEDRSQFAWRAVARYRVNDFTGAAEDLFRALDKVEACQLIDLPPSAIYTALGCIYATKLQKWTQAAECYAAALRDTPICSSPAYEPFARFLTYFDDLYPIKDGIDPLLETQRCLISAHSQSCLTVSEAVERFWETVNQAGQTIHEELWQANQEIGVELVKVFARRGEIAECITWITRLVLHTDLDVTNLQNDSDISCCMTLVQYLTPRWSYTVEHGMFSNRLTITNESPFPINDYVISIAAHGKSPMQLEKQGNHLRPGQQRQWRNIFKDAGFLGGNVESVKVQLRCRQGQAHLIQEGKVSKSPIESDWERIVGGLVVFLLLLVGMGIRSCSSDGAVQTNSRSGEQHMDYNEELRKIFNRRRDRP